MAALKSSRRELQRTQASQVLVILGTLAVLYFAREILVPLAFALILAFLLTPLVTRLERFGIRRVAAVILTMILATAAAGYAGWLIANQLVQIANELPQYRANIHDKIDALQTSGKGALGQAAESLKTIGEDLSREPAAPKSGEPTPVRIVTGGGELSTIWSLAQPTLVRLAATGIVLIFTVFILIEKEDLRNRILRLAGVGQLNLMTEALDDAGHRVSRYLLMQLLVNSTFGVLVAFGLYFIGVPHFWLWAVVAGILRLVPYVGILMAGAMPLALSLAVFGTWMEPLLVFLLFAAIELITSNFVEPMLYGTHTGISSLAILVTTVFLGIALGAC